MARMGSREIKSWAAVFAAILALAALVWADEVIEMRTYVTGSTDRLVANRATIGFPYRPGVVPDASVPDGTLLVSGNAGVGTASPRSDPPNRIPTGNLDANDLFVRGANRWATQSVSAGMNSHLSGGENFSALNLLSASEVLLVSVTMSTAGRPVMAWGRVAGNFSVSAGSLVIRLYRDGVLTEETRVPARGPDFGVVMKTETPAAGSHLFELKASASGFTSATVNAGGAKLVVIEI